ncbi:hypothetical protein, partial [uncultured Microbulbifer sp.]|uniref:DUF6942 family protein n=1 Tax=uncultured Microbulbifer sp. TaxID=348147 RepID=UPI0025F67FD7
KIVNLLAKIASPDESDWRCFRDEALFLHTALCFSPTIQNTAGWHWIGGKETLQRFRALQHRARPLHDCAEVAMDVERQLLLTPYPDYRQLSNILVTRIRTRLSGEGFYTL